MYGTMVTIGLFEHLNKKKALVVETLLALFDFLFLSF